MQKRHVFLFIINYGNQRTLLLNVEGATLCAISALKPKGKYLFPIEFLKLLNIIELWSPPQNAVKMTLAARVKLSYLMLVTNFCFKGD